MNRTDYRDCIAITNRHLAGREYFEQIRRIVSLGPYALILREKDLTDEEYEAYAERVKPVCDAYGVLFYLHGHIDLAKRFGRNVHLPYAGFMELHKGGRLHDLQNISVACHSLEEALRAEECGASEIILGTIFETDCKKGLKGRGTDFVSTVSAACKIPVYAIGGIKPDNLDTVKAAGAAGGCMMSWFMQK